MCCVTSILCIFLCVVGTVQIVVYVDSGYFHVLGWQSV